MADTCAQMAEATISFEYILRPSKLCLHFDSLFYILFVI